MNEAAGVEDARIVWLEVTGAKAGGVEAGWKCEKRLRVPGAEYLS